jgi:hypothetical protein
MRTVLLQSLQERQQVLLCAQHPAAFLQDNPKRPAVFMHAVPVPAVVH